MAPQALSLDSPTWSTLPARTRPSSTSRIDSIAFSGPGEGLFQITPFEPNWGTGRSGQWSW